MKVAMTPRIVDAAMSMMSIHMLSWTAGQWYRCILSITNDSLPVTVDAAILDRECDFASVSVVLRVSMEYSTLLRQQN